MATFFYLIQREVYNKINKEQTSFVQDFNHIKLLTDLHKSSLNNSEQFFYEQVLLGVSHVNENYTDASTTLASLALPKTTASSPTSDQMVEDHASQRSSDLRSVKVAPIRNEGRGPQCYRSTISKYATEGGNR